MSVSDNSLLSEPNNVMLEIVDISKPDNVSVSRAELEQEHTHLLGRLQQLRRLLGYAALPTGKQLRREQNKLR